ncbi:MAG: acyl carrier protein [Chitinivibrionia bacterium]|nr:acyl carrier protein [Chitinivibrionia bacterium]
MIEKLQKIIREAKGDDKLSVTPEMVLISDLKLDSFDVAQLVNEIENEFGIRVNDRDINNFKTVKNILDYIEEKQKQKQQ